MESFLVALKKEIGMYAEYSQRESFETIFFGGGTPSLLKPNIVGEILDLLRSTFRIQENAEITLETNPGTVDRTKLRQFLDVGVNRLSFGVQSFYDDDLRFLTRIHSSEQAKECIRTAQDVGFDNVGLDLIFALPNQTLARWEENLRQAIALQTKHISAYSLIVEQGTPLARMVNAKQVSPLPLDTEAEMYEHTMVVLNAQGFEHYEVSNYALPGYRSRHNSNYWNHSNYIGFGPSAHSFWNDRRWWNVANLRTYCEKILSHQLPIAGGEHLSQSQLFDEAIMLGLRGEGVNVDRVKKHHHVDLLQLCSSTICDFVNENLLTIEKPLLRLTDKGYMVCDEISQVLLSRISA
jgi:oxygen-independent coproporphyrinogen-3 oxidase